MKRKPSDFTAEQLADSALKASRLEREAYKLLKPDVEIVPKGFRTVRDWSVIWEKSVSWTMKLMRRLIIAGHVESKLIRIASRKNTLPVPHYRLIDR